MEWSIIIDGLFTALEPMNMVWLIFGALLGTIVGILPGLGPATGVAVLIPLTFGMNPVSALILMSSIYYGALLVDRGVPYLLIHREMVRPLRRRSTVIQ